MENKNEEYAQLLELAAKKIRNLKNPISKRTERAIEKVSTEVINEKNKIANLSNIEKMLSVDIKERDKREKIRQQYDNRSAIEKVAARYRNIDENEKGQYFDERV